MSTSNSSFSTSKKLKIGDSESRSGSQQKTEETDVDRISSLPNGVLHYILSFLDMKYVVQASVLSTRWRYLWASLPVLNFNSKISVCSGANRSMKDQKVQFMKFVDMVFYLRHRAVDIHQFRLFSNSSPDISTRRLSSWLIDVVRKNVQVLDLTILQGKQLKLPDCIFTCKSLIQLKLSLYHGFHLPSWISLPSLKILHLKNICFVDEKLTSNLFSSCPTLEFLTIEDFEVKLLKNLIISAPTLTHFVIRNPYKETWPDGCKIKIYAPNLTSFSCKDRIIRDYHLERCVSLDTASIDIDIRDYYSYFPQERRKLIANRQKEYAERMIAFLSATSNLKALTMSATLFEFLSEPPAVLKSLTLQFCNLRYLELKTWLSQDSIHGIMHLMNISPNIETLQLEMFQAYNMKDPIYQYWDETKCSLDGFFIGLSPQYLLNHLKFIKIRNVLGRINELKFLEILLDAASVLEKMVVVTTKERMLTKFKEKLLTFPRASSNIETLFL